MYFEMYQITYFDMDLKMASTLNMLLLLNKNISNIDLNDPQVFTKD